MGVSVTSSLPPERFIAATNALLSAMDSKEVIDSIHGNLGNQLLTVYQKGQRFGNVSVKGVLVSSTGKHALKEEGSTLIVPVVFLGNRTYDFRGLSN